MSEPTIIIFSHTSRLGDFSISLPASHFEFELAENSRTYRLTIDSCGEYKTHYQDPYFAMLAVARHQTAHSTWDDSNEKISPDWKEWTFHLTEAFRIKLIENYQRKNGCTYRTLLEFFETSYFYVLNRRMNDPVSDYAKHLFGQ